MMVEMAGIWGKVIGGVAGFALLGGPLGALIGAAAGHYVDKKREAEGLDGRAPSGPEELTASKQAAFTIAMIALGAKMAKADGQVTRDEVDAFKEIFSIPEGEMKSVGKLFDQAKRSSEGYEVYAKQVGDMFRGNPAVLEELLAGLFHIAKADGVVHPAEITFLRGVARVFGFTDTQFEQMRETRLGSMPDVKSDPYVILGVSSDISDTDLKTEYRKLVREHHPDTLMAQGLPQEFIDLAHEKMAAINAAYDEITRRRGL
ncbi:TerB family tellurite resistance protein [Magnetospira sp. QH-2]|uniref:TerB family tellurite resistance protein n=1 Tax=Magnetospira sp. (strain QH-2) TaxID=1288970 RepID=UPI0003E80D22|nr:TerB family tellurite resistance protein [Magnetospira sp. QH-2]CCQ72823.1 putative DnaJ-like protein DjlA [Magnetospira sp. QH-2]